MASGAYKTVADRQSCVTQGTGNGHEKKSRLFLAAGRVKFVAMYILGPLLKTKLVNQHLDSLADGYTKLTRVILVTKVASINSSTVFVDYWVIS